MIYSGHTQGSFGTVREFNSCAHCEPETYSHEDLPAEYPGVPDDVFQKVLDFYPDEEQVSEIFNALEGLALRFSLITEEYFKDSEDGFDGDWCLLLDTEIEELIYNG